MNSPVAQQITPATAVETSIASGTACLVDSDRTGFCFCGIYFV